MTVCSKDVACIEYEDRHEVSPSIRSYSGVAQPRLLALALGQVDSGEGQSNHSINHPVSLLSTY